MKIKVDSNEAWENSKIVDGLKSLGNEIEVVHLEVGDYIYGRTLIEHKRLANYVGDVTNGHLFQQCQDMRYSMKQDPNLKCYVLISGSIEDIFKLTNIPNIRPDGQIAAWASLNSEHYGIPTHFLGNVWFTVHGMHYLFQKDNDGKVPEVNPIRQPITLENEILTNYASIDRIGAEKARKIREKFPKPKDFYNATAEQLKQVDGFGEKTVNRLLKLFDGRE